MCIAPIPSHYRPDQLVERLALLTVKPGRLNCRLVRLELARRHPGKHPQFPHVDPEAGGECFQGSVGRSSVLPGEVPGNHGSVDLVPCLIRETYDVIQTPGALGIL